MVFFLLPVFTQLARLGCAIDPFFYDLLPSVVLQMKSLHGMAIFKMLFCLDLVVTILNLETRHRFLPLNYYKMSKRLSIL